MDFMLSKLKKIIPEPVFKLFQPVYHFTLSFLGALIYRFPSRNLTVIGVTGTKGKTTTCNLIAQILNSSGFKTGMATTVNFKIADREWPNTTKQTMLGRFGLQKLLRQMVKENCEYAVIETSSEGILQYRHRFIDYNIVVFTNLTPEHLERHGGFENYRKEKLKLFKKIEMKKDGVGIYNLDDENVLHFLEPKIKTQYVYTLKLPDETINIPNLYRVSDIRYGQNETKFLFNKEEFEMPLKGEFNVYNMAAAICVAISQNIPMEKIKRAVKEIKPVAGRMEIIESPKDFKVVIDYAHEPASLEAIYKAVIKSKLKANSSKLICLLGAQGGGRDKWKRPKMGEIAAKYCDKIILTNEDPYDENPNQILDEIETGFLQTKSLKLTAKSLLKIIDRKEAIQKAISLAKKGDVVILTGKGGEVWMCVENNKKIPWDEKQITLDILNKV